MKLLTISNLYPRPDQPWRGMYNAQLFHAFAETGVRKEKSVAEKSGFALCREAKQVPCHPELAGGSPGRADAADSATSLGMTGSAACGHFHSCIIGPGACGPLTNICLVPEWRVWRWGTIRRWRNPLCDSFETKYLPVFYVPLMGRNLSWRTYLASLADLRSIVRHCDAVYCAWLYPDGAAATLLAAESGKPAWIMALGSDTFHLRNASRRRIILKACRKAAGVVCVCKLLADRLLDAGVEPSKVHVVPNGVDTQLFRYRSREDAFDALCRHPEISPPRQPHTSPPRYALFVGNLSFVKGPDILLESWSQLRRQPMSGSAARQLLFIGDGPMRRSLERNAARLGISDSTTFLGARPHNEIALWMNAADVLCVPSRSEGMPNVVLEALASGLPVAATDVGACGEMLEDEPAARVVPAGSADLLGEAMLEMLSMEIDRRALAGRHAVRTWGGQAERIIDLIGTGGQGGTTEPVVHA